MCMETRGAGGCQAVFVPEPDAFVPAASMTPEANEPHREIGAMRRTSILALLGCALWGRGMLQGVCAQSGAGNFTGDLRCHHDAVQVKCRS